SLAGDVRLHESQHCRGETAQVNLRDGSLDSLVHTLWHENPLG
ncbi:MAG: hypothetical protein QOG75_5991, partial [Mycobacterium sp.]|nr:hypothetical protein [Mycobacterium sp.]